MNREILESQWTQIRDVLKEKFSNLTEDDIRQINGQYDQLVAKLQQKYGYTREEAEDRIKNWNIDRLSNLGTNRQPVREDRQYTQQAKALREEDATSPFKWFLAIGIPLLLLGLYMFSTSQNPETVRTTTTNQEQLSTETPSDLTLSNNLRNTLLSRPAIASEIQNIQITTNNGVVTLSGTVSDREIRDSIERNVRSQPGVREINNRLQVR